jgi:hypothetical protein
MRSILGLYHPIGMENRSMSIKVVYERLRSMHLPDAQLDMSCGVTSLDP